MSKEIIPSPGGSNKFSRLISKIKAALGIVEESNTATHSIAAGKYVTWKGDLYKAKSAISSGAALSSSNLEAVPDGGFNALSEQIGTLNSNINQRLIFRCEYIEIQFTSGYGEYDLSAKLSAIGKTNAYSPITMISGSTVRTEPCIRANDMANDKHTLKVSLTTSYSGTVGCFVLFYAT